ncbi:hypothetical protein JZU68_08500, partial [bacterium]|nr:hypothetical protein [bacterium]
LMSKILTQHGEREKIAGLFKVSRQTVNSALRGATKSDLSKRIRKMAIERGGAEMVTENSLKIKINEND